MSPHKTFAFRCFLISILYGYFASFGGIDPVSLWVFSFIEDLSLVDSFSIIHLPKPMDDYIFRPVSAAIVKLIMLFWSVENAQYVVMTKTAICSFIFGISCYFWILTHVDQRRAFIGATLSMLVEPVLFSAYNLTEYDTLGAAFLLLASTISAKKMHTQGYLLFTILLFLTIFLKISTCMLAFVFIGLQAILKRKEFPVQTRNMIVILLGLTALWAICCLPLLTGSLRSNAGGLPTSQRIPIMLFTAGQFIALYKESGILILGIFLACSFHQKIGTIFGLLLVSFSTTFSIVQLNHFQTYYYAPLEWGQILLGLLWLFWLWAARRKTNHIIGQLSITIIATQLLFFLAIYISSDLREDIASRIFVLFCPIAIYSVFYCGFSLLKAKPSGPLGKVNKCTVFGLLVAFHWNILADVINYCGKIRAEEPTYDSILEKSMKMLNTNTTFLFTDYNRPYDPYQMAQIAKKHSIEATDLNKIRNSFISHFLTDGKLPNRIAFWDIPLTQLDNEKRPLLLIKPWTVVPYSKRQKDILQQDFDWLRGQSGSGDHATLDGLSENFSRHSMLEDGYIYEYTNTPSQLSSLLQKDFLIVETQQETYTYVPYRLQEIPFRLFHGIPIFEKRKFRVELWTKNQKIDE